MKIQSITQTFELYLGKPLHTLSIRFLMTRPPRIPNATQNGLVTSKISTSVSLAQNAQAALGLRPIGMNSRRPIFRCALLLRNIWPILIKST